MPAMLSFTFTVRRSVDSPGCSSCAPHPQARQPVPGLGVCLRGAGAILLDVLPHLWAGKCGMQACCSSQAARQQPAPAESPWLVFVIAPGSIRQLFLPSSMCCLPPGRPCSTGCLESM